MSEKQVTREFIESIIEYLEESLAEGYYMKFEVEMEDVSRTFTLKRDDMDQQDYQEFREDYDKLSTTRYFELPFDATNP